MGVVSGLVLAAGKSRRMGTDKALMTIEGTPLWRRQRDLLLSVGAAELFLSARPEQPWTRAADGFTAVLHDAFPDCGPIAGICAGLERMTGSHVAVVAIDLPKLPSSWLQRLVANCTAGAGSVGRRGELFEPLAAVYPREARWLVSEHLARGDYSLQGLLKASVDGGLMRVVPIAADEESCFENWNEPQDLS